MAFHSDRGILEIQCESVNESEKFSKSFSSSNPLSLDNFSFLALRPLYKFLIQQGVSGGGAAAPPHILALPLYKVYLVLVPCHPQSSCRIPLALIVELIATSWTHNFIWNNNEYSMGSNLSQLGRHWFLRHLQLFTSWVPLCVVQNLLVFQEMWYPDPEYDRVGWLRLGKRVG